MDVTTAALERYQREGLDARTAKHLVPYFPSLPVDNLRSGFFARAEVEALLQHVASVRQSPAACLKDGPRTRRSRASASVREAIAACLEARAANGMPVTVAFREVEVAV